MRIFRRVLIVLLSAVGALPASEAAEQKLPPACSLLTTGEVGAASRLALGSPADRETRMTIGPLRGQTIRSCVWPTGLENGVTLNITSAVPGGAQAPTDQSYDALKRQGYLVDERVFGNGMCMAVTPTAAARTKTSFTTCSLQAKGTQLVMMVPSAASAVPVDTVKQLADRAIARLP